MNSAPRGVNAFKRVLAAILDPSRLPEPTSLYPMLAQTSDTIDLEAPLVVPPLICVGRAPSPGGRTAERQACEIRIGRTLSRRAAGCNEEGERGPDKDGSGQRSQRTTSDAPTLSDRRIQQF